MSKAEFTNQLHALERRLTAMLSKKVIHKHLVEHYGQEIINAIIGVAKSGIGPGDRPYQGYSESYKKQIAKHGGRKLFLRSIGEQGREGGMLDPARFTYEISGDGRLWLVWSAANNRMGVYAEVHNKGLRIGPHGPSIKREWAHVESARANRAVVSAYNRTMNDLAAQVARGQMPR